MPHFTSADSAETIGRFAASLGRACDAYRRNAADACDKAEIMTSMGTTLEQIEDTFRTLRVRRLDEDGPVPDRSQDPPPRYAREWKIGFSGEAA